MAKVILGQLQSLGFETPCNFGLCPLDMQRSLLDEEGGLAQEKKKSHVEEYQSVPSQQPMPTARHVSDTSSDLSAQLTLQLNAAT